MELRRMCGPGDWVRPLRNFTGPYSAVLQNLIACRSARWVIRGADKLILLVDKNHGRNEIRHLARLQPGFSHDDDLVATVKMPRRWTVQADVAPARFAFDYVCLPEDAVREIGDVHILKWANATSLKQLPINRDRSNVVQIGLSNGGLMNLGHADSDEQSNSSPRIRIGYWAERD